MVLTFWSILYNYDILAYLSMTIIMTFGPFSLNIVIFM